MAHINKYNLFYRNFDSVRHIVRSAFLYGGYSKFDYCNLTGISPRKYEDITRFMRAVFGDDYNYNNKGKEKYAKLNYKAFEGSSNPLAKVAFYKTFTANDYNCFFYILDIMCVNKQGMKIDEIADEISKLNAELNNTGTIRIKINALVDEGYIIKKRQGRIDYYYPAKDFFEILTKNDLAELADYLTLAKDIYRNRIPLYTLAAKLPISKFSSKIKLTEYYPAQILDSEVREILETAIEGNHVIEFKNTNSKKEIKDVGIVVPFNFLKGDYGREYVLCFSPLKDRHEVYRLDRISHLKLSIIKSDVKFDECCIKNVWCASITANQTEHCLEIDFDFEGDGLLDKQLNMSKKYGEIKKINGIHRFTVTVKDFREMLPMLRTFYSYIIRINHEDVKAMVVNDIKDIVKVYSHV